MSNPKLPVNSMTYKFLTEMRMRGPVTVKSQSKRRLPSTDVTHLYSKQSIEIKSKPVSIPRIKWWKVCPSSIKSHSPRYISDKLKSDVSPEPKSITGMKPQ